MKARDRKILVLALIVIAFMAPPFFGAMVGRLDLATPWFYGSVISVIACFISVRLALVLVPIAGACAGIAVLLHPYPLLGGLFMALLAGGAAYTARRGLHSATLMVPVFTAFPLVQPPLLAGNPPPGTLALLTGIATLLGGLWVILVMRVLLGSHMPHSRIAAVGPRTATFYAVLMGLLVGVAAWAVLSYAPYHSGAWLLLTLIIVLQPDTHDSVQRCLQRTAGTVLGVAVAFAISLVLTSSVVLLSLATVLAFAAFVARYVMKRPYWEYTAIITPAVILMSSPTPGSITATAEDRLFFTAVAAAVVLAIALTLKFGYDHWYAPRHPESTSPAPS